MTTGNAISINGTEAPRGQLRAWMHRMSMRRRERAAILELEAISDDHLRDMGLTRDGIRHAVRFGRHC